MSIQPGVGYNLASNGGAFSLVIDQQQYLQGFMAVEQLCLTKKYGFSGLFVNTGGGFIDKSNVDDTRNWGNNGK